MACHADPVATTTYRKDYKMDKFRPAIRMTSLPMLMPGRELCTGQWKPSIKKVPQPPSNSLFASYEPRTHKKPQSPAPASEKPKTESLNKARLKVLNTKFGAMDMAEIDRLAYKLKWTPTAKATEEAHVPLPEILQDFRKHYIPREIHLPKATVPTDLYQWLVSTSLWYWFVGILALGSKGYDEQPLMLSTDLKRHDHLPKTDTRLKTLEPKADMIRFDVCRYDVKPRLWQQAELFDRFQLRQPVERVVYPYDKTRENKLLARRGREAPELPNAGKIRSLLETNEIGSTYIRKCPGYAGYVPQMPPNGNMTKAASVNPSMISTMRATYREIPVQEFPKRQFARKPPFSKMMTLTYPFNPYNKLEVTE